MTLVFTFPINDAWVIIADRLIIGKDGSYNFEEDIEHKERLDNTTKIEHFIGKNLVFAGAGDNDLLELFVEKIGIKNSLDEFKTDFEGLCNSLRSGGEFEQSVTNTEFIIINQTNLEAFKFINGKYKKIDGCSEGFVGYVKKLKNFNDVKADLIRRSNYDFDSNDDEVIMEWVYSLEKLAKQKLYSVGHPAIDGCNIWIVEKNKIQKIFVSPKNYEWEIKND